MGTLVRPMSSSTTTSLTKIAQSTKTTVIPFLTLLSILLSSIGSKKSILLTTSTIPTITTTLSATTIPSLSASLKLSPKTSISVSSTKTSLSISSTKTSFPCSAFPSIHLKWYNQSYICESRLTQLSQKNIHVSRSRDRLPIQG